MINADQIAVVQSGKVVELGRHEELVALGGEYAKLVQRQVKKKESVLRELPAKEKEKEQEEEDSSSED